MRVPLVPAIGVDFGLSKALLMQPDSTPKTLAAILGFAIDDDGLCTLQLRLFLSHPSRKLFVGHANGSGNMAEFIIDRGTHIDEHGSRIRPEIFGLGQVQKRNSCDSRRI